MSGPALSPEVDSSEWLIQTLCAAAGIDTLRPLQEHLCYELAVLKHHVFASAAPGQGKTLVLLSGPLASQARGGNGIALLVVPTKALAEQQAGICAAATARKYGLRSLAINEDSIRENPTRDLLRELEEGADIRVATISPQMLLGGMTKLLDKRSFLKKVRWMLIDEAHLVDDYTVFGEHYRNLSTMRAVLGSDTVWAAVSGSVPKERRAFTAVSLGFRPGSFVDALYSQDVPHVKHICRFFRHSTTQGTFHDLSWLIPRSAKTVADIPQAIVFVNSITQDGLQLERYLDHLLRILFPNDNSRLLAVRPYNSLLRYTERELWARDFANGTIRIGVVTESLTFGLDLIVPTVVDLGLCADMSRMKQRRGRAGRRGEGRFIHYSPAWVEEIDEALITTATARENKRKRSELDPTILAYCNPTMERCARAVDLKHYGDPQPSGPSACLCEIHQPGDDAKDFALVQEWLDYFEKDIKNSAPAIPRSDGTFKPISSARLKRKLAALLDDWSAVYWYGMDAGTDEPSGFFLPECVVRDIVEKAHVCGANYDAFEAVARAAGWIYLADHGRALFRYLQQTMKEIDSLWRELALEESDEDDGDSDVEVVTTPPPPPSSSPVPMSPPASPMRPSTSASKENENPVRSVRLKLPAPPPDASNKRPLSPSSPRSAAKKPPSKKGRRK
ncbi:P-loop containing nucleoside triphosphate hydrolase protein [Schizophyllum commune]